MDGKDEEQQGGEKKIVRKNADGKMLTKIQKKS